VVVSLSGGGHVARKTVCIRTGVQETSRDMGFEGGPPTHTHLITATRGLQPAVKPVLG
jgi:hypothetical protein